MGSPKTETGSTGSFGLDPMFARSPDLLSIMKGEQVPGGDANARMQMMFMQMLGKRPPPAATPAVVAPRRKPVYENASGPVPWALKVRR
jgi:hypothetical protein